MNAPRIEPSPSGVARLNAKDAWTAFWQEPGQAQCMAGAPDVVQAQAEHWWSFAASLAPGARILDLGCGEGAVARALLAARRDLRVTGVDFAKIPLLIHDQAELLSDTAMEALPFADGSFGAAVSQFGFEYSETNRAAKEMARVLVHGGKISLLIHHAESSIVAVSRARLNALVAFLAPTTRAAFCSGDAPAFDARMAALTKMHPRDAVIAALARSLPSRAGRAQAERLAIWRALEGALAPERCVLGALDVCCVAPGALDDWLAPLRGFFALRPASVLRTPSGRPLAWKIEGARAVSAAAQ
jgi:SAM-dependent methyltransferase